MGAQDVHLDFQTAPELCRLDGAGMDLYIYIYMSMGGGEELGLWPDHRKSRASFLQ